MERRYLVAALAMILAFAATSHGFRALQQMSWVHVRHSGAMAHSMHAPSCAARALAKIHTHLRPRYPEEAQLLAEMTFPWPTCRRRSSSGWPNRIQLSPKATVSGQCRTRNTPIATLCACSKA